MRLRTVALVTAFSAFGLSAEAQSCGVLCDEYFWLTASQTEVAAEKSKADVEARDHWGRTALMLASAYGSAANVNALLDAGADLDVRALDGWTALMFAASKQASSENIEVLLREGAALDA